MIFPWYVLVYNHPEKIKIIDSFYFVSIQSGFERYMTNVLLSRMENHIFRLGDIHGEAIYYKPFPDTGEFSVNKFTGCRNV